jgi:hypothetical protein
MGKVALDHYLDKNSTFMKEKLDRYLEKSGDSYDTFMENRTDDEWTENVQLYKKDNHAWIEYRTDQVDADGDKVFYIITAYNEKDAKVFKVWSDLQGLAKKNKCKYIQFVTSRNPKAWQRRFGMYPTQYKMEIKL